MCVIVIRSQVHQGGLCGLAALYWALTDTLFTPSQVNLQICIDFFWLLELVLWTLTDTIYTLSLVNLLSAVVILAKIFIVIAIALFTPRTKRPGNSCNLQILVKCQSQSLCRFCSVFGIMHLIFSTMYGSWYLATRCHVFSKMLINCQQVTKMGYKDMRGAIEETIGEKKSQETDEEILQIYHQCE